MTSPAPLRLRPTTLSVVGSSPGPPSPLPALTPVRAATFPEVDPSAPAEMRERIARGRLRSPLPYAVLSDYDRADDALDLPAIELDNGEVRAVVVPALGGRVWSLTDLRTGRELVHRPPRLRWANFGLTDAWFAGGIEWNLGSTGHSTLSNRPMHAAAVDTPDGPVLRLWEWERTRDLILQVDLWLDRSRLLAATRVTNPDPQDKPLYYWTNIAVTETPGTRVLVPADSAWRTNYAGRLERVAVPHPDGEVDMSVPRSSLHPADYFYEVENQRGRIVTAVEPGGHGLAQTSTSALRGRKLFLWGHGPGGSRWQEWLQGPGATYLEIQAGVCPTQLEHDLLPGGASLSWVEAFAPITLEPADVRGDYATATRAARTATHAVAPPAWLDGAHARWLAGTADLAPTKTLHEGSGWGRVELILRGEPAPRATPFPEVDDDSAPFLAMARGTGTRAPAIDDVHPPLPPVSERWRDALSGAADATASWWVEYALATAAHARGDAETARAAYARSVAAHPSAVALRGLALLTEDDDARLAHYARAHALSPRDRRLTVEWLEQLRDAERPDDIVRVVATLDPDLREHGRTRLLLAQAHAALGERGAAAAILDTLVVPDLAEGDLALTRLWHEVHPGEPVPDHLDFAMVATRD